MVTSYIQPDLDGLVQRSLVCGEGKLGYMCKSALKQWLHELDFAVLKCLYKADTWHTITVLLIFSTAWSHAASVYLATGSPEMNLPSGE